MKHCKDCRGTGRVVAMIHTKFETSLDFINCPSCIAGRALELLGLKR